MEYTVTASSTQIDFGATGLTEIMQNVRTIVSTTMGTVPLEREFGIDTGALDNPLPVTRVRMTGRIIEAIQLYEPRVEVTKVNYQVDALEGRLIPIVKIRLKESVNL